MRLALAATLLAATAVAQAPLIQPCGSSASCVQVGSLDGGSIILGGNVTASKKVTLVGDGGAGPAVQVVGAQLAPSTSGQTLSVMGGQTRTSTEPDVVIGGLNARDGGQGPIVKFVTGNYPIAVLNSSGLVVNGTISGGAQSLSSLSVAGDLGVGGVSTLVALDAGVGSKVSGQLIARGAAQDAGVAQPFMQWGYGAMTAGELAVTFTTPFAFNASCVCSHTQTTNTNACGVKTGTAVTATAATFAVASGNTDTIYWQCMGHK